MLNKKSALRLIAALLSASALGMTMTGCAESDKTTAETTAQTTAAETVTETTTEAKLVPNLPEMDFEGYDYRVLTRGQYNIHWKSRDIYAAELNGEPMNDAIYERNSRVGEQYNFTITEKDDKEDFLSAASKSILAGEDAYDMLLLNLGGSVYSLIQNGMLVDLYTMPYIDLTQPWYDQNCNASISIAGKLHATVGDLNTMDNDATWTILFNKQLAADLGIGDLYAMVNDGSWTLDVFYNTIQNASRDLNGDDIHDETDQWGVIGEAFNTGAMIIGSGEHVISKDSDDMPYITIQTEKFYSAFEKANRINGNFDNCMFASNFTAKYAGDSVWGDCIDKCFSEGRALYNFAGMNRVTLFRSMDTDFGIIPIPKYDEEQSEYYNIVSMWCTNSISVPKTNSDLERTGIIIEALSAESMYTLTPAYYEVTLKGKSSRDEESSAMLDLIFSTRVYDLGNMYGWGGLFDIPGSLTTNKKTDIASAIEKSMKSAQTALDKTVAKILETD